MAYDQEYIVPASKLKGIIEIVEKGLAEKASKTIILKNIQAYVLEG